MSKLSFEQAEALLTPEQRSELARCLLQDAPLPEPLSDAQRTFFMGLSVLCEYELRSDVEAYLLAQGAHSAGAPFNPPDNTYGESNRNEYRRLTREEFACISPALEQCGGCDPWNVFRFVDTRLDKTYDVYLLNSATRSILKKTDAAAKEASAYSRYFEGHPFSVPKIMNCFSVNGERFVQMEFAGGADARGCSETESKRIGQALADIQSYYLTAGGRTEKAESYFKKQVAKHIEAVRAYYPDYAPVFSFVEQRFFEAPQTLIHDDFLPINVLLDDRNIRIIDWEYAEILPYFLDLGRFAFVYDKDNRFFLSRESAASFLQSYYDRMKKNPGFCVSENQFRLDIAVSAFCQYVLFLSCSLHAPDAKPFDASHDSIDRQYFQKIIEHLQDACDFC